MKRDKYPLALLGCLIYDTTIVVVAILANLYSPVERRVEKILGSFGSVWATGLAHHIREEEEMR